MKFRILLRSLPVVFMVMIVGMPAQAGMVATDQIQNPGVTAEIMDISGQRDWIEARLMHGGIAQPEAVLRVSALTDVEVAQIYQRIDDVPAGGSDILIIALVIFVVLEVTGYIDVIPEK